MQMEKNMSSDENLNDAQRNVGGPSQEAIPQLRKSKERSASQSQEGSLGERMGEETRHRRGRSRELPSADKLGKSDKRKKKHPLRNVPEYLIGNISVVIPWKGGHDFSLQVNSFMQIVQAPKNKELGDKLDLGDILVKFNDIEVPDKRLLRTVMEEFNKENLHKTETEVKLVLKRMKYLEALPINSPKIPPVIEIQGAIFNYFQGFMLLHPQSSVGMKIKTYNSKVYVTSTDNGFFCIAKRTLLVGDAILAVDDKPVANNRECGTMITNALGDRGFVSLIIERPADAQVAGPLVRAALMADKQQELDPRMADDVVEICRQEILNRQPDVLYKREHVKPILRVKRGRSKQKIGFKEKSTEFTIDMDPINPLLLRRVPPPAERGVPKGQNALIPPAPSSSPIGSHHSGQLHHPQLINKGPKQVVLVKKGTWQQHL